jgi:hypothetical protein
MVWIAAQATGNARRNLRGIHARLNKMMTLPKDFCRIKNQNSPRKGICSQGLVSVGLAAMIAIGFCFLAGCGSDSKPTNAKNEKAVATTAPKAKSQAAMPLLHGQKALLKAPQMSLNSEGKPVFMGVTREEMEARVEADRKKFEAMRGVEVFPGVTREEMEARVEADRKRVEAMRGVEVFPGVTREEMEARVEAESRKPYPHDAQIFPGVTLGQLSAKVAQQQAERPDKSQLLKDIVGKKDVKK